VASKLKVSRCSKLDHHAHFSPYKTIKPPGYSQFKRVVATAQGCELIAITTVSKFGTSSSEGCSSPISLTPIREKATAIGPACFGWFFRLLTQINAPGLLMATERWRAAPPLAKSQLRVMHLIVIPEFPCLAIKRWVDRRRSSAQLVVSQFPLLNLNGSTNLSAYCLILIVLPGE
jgi:hypothetical protein